jgi:phosphoribosylpyrophosphate synthetase
VITDSISPERIDLGPARDKLSVLSIAPLLARAISALHRERSITEVMEE